MLVSQPKAIANPWGTPAFFTSTTSYLQESANSTSLEWAVESPTPYHAFNMMPVQS
ncbi:MAG: hypothetical protein JZD40_04785 [Sulfolobus sp.]|nr:hypothetical protein [Sulfolobus sp.]